MQPISQGRISGSTQKSVATRYTQLRVEIRQRVDRIRLEMQTLASRGFQQLVSEVMEYRKERVSRELSQVEKLSVELFLAEVALHREEGRPERADRLLATLNAGQPLRVSTSGAVVIRMSDGQMFLDLQ